MKRCGAQKKKRGREIERNRDKNVLEEEKDVL
jgi:hypothetical protein